MRDVGKPLAYVKRDAVAAWKRFVSCVAMLPPDQVRPLWRAVAAEAAARRMQSTAQPMKPETLAARIVTGTIMRGSIDR